MSEDNGSDRRTNPQVGSDPNQQSDPSDTGRPDKAGSDARTDERAAKGIRPNEIIGLRAWRVRERDRLYSVYFDKFEWLPGQPLKGTPEEPNALNMWAGLSGIHAFKDQVHLDEYLGYAVWPIWSMSEIAVDTDGLVWGSVELWGTVWEHKDGYRAQYARPLHFHGADGDVDIELIRKRFKRTGLGND